MNAVVFDKKESHNAFIFREVEKPAPDGNEVLVKIYAASVNAGDYRSMKMGIIPKGRIFGSDIAGRVEAVGKNISQFEIGDEVLGDISACGLGGFAEYVAVPETPLSLKPAAVSFEEAAAVPMAAVTALQALRNKGCIQAGEKVLICGAGGGVGSFAVQLARHYGAEVTAICSTKNVESMRSLGASHVIDYMKEDFSKSGEHYDLILAINGYQPLSVYKRALNSKGIAVIVGGALSQVIKSMLFGPFMSLGDRKVLTLSAKPDKKDLEFVIRLVEEGRIKPVIDRCYPLNETAEAVRYLSEGHSHGKVIINVFKEQ